MNYQIICTTDLYHAARYSGFNKFKGTKVIGTYATEDDAFAALGKLFKAHYPGAIYFDSSKEMSKYADAVGVAFAEFAGAGYYECENSLLKGAKSFGEDIFTYTLEQI